MDKKKVGIIAGAVAIAIIAVVLIIVLANKKEAYRLICLEGSDGTVGITRDSSAIDVFDGMNLISEDDLETAEGSTATLLADSDKHIVVNPDSFLHIIAIGNEKKGKIGIDIVRGAAHFAIDNPLPKNSEFEVTTPNALLSVRGTIFEVSYFDDYKATLVRVIEGVVSAKAFGSDEEILVNAGESILIIENPDGEIETIYPYENADSGLDGIKMLYRTDANVWFEKADGTRFFEFYNEDAWVEVESTSSYEYQRIYFENPENPDMPLVSFMYSDFSSSGITANERMKIIYNEGEYVTENGTNELLYYKVVDSVDTEFGLAKVVLHTITSEYGPSGMYVAIFQVDEDTYVELRLTYKLYMQAILDDGSVVSKDTVDINSYREYADIMDRDKSLLEEAKKKIVELCRYN